MGTCEGVAVVRAETSGRRRSERPADTEVPAASQSSKLKGWGGLAATGVFLSWAASGCPERIGGGAGGGIWSMFGVVLRCCR